MKNLLLTLLFLPLFTQAQVIVTVAGTGPAGYNGDNKPATAAELATPYGLALDDSGNLYINDEGNFRIRKVSPAYGGIITTIAGNGTVGYSGDNDLGIHAQINGGYDVAVDHHGNVYFPEGNNIRKVSSSDTITTIAGTGAQGYNGDNIPATSAQLNQPINVTVDSIGNVYIVDRFNYRIRKIDTSGIITTIAGTGVAGSSPDGSRADTSAISKLLTLKMDRQGNLFFSDSNRIRRIDAGTGLITTVAGNGIQGYSGDNGLAIAAEITAAAIAIDRQGDLFFADDVQNHIRMVNKEGVITTIAGDGSHWYNGDNIAPLLSGLGGPQGIAVNDSGDIYIADVANDRVRLITMHPMSVKNPGRLSDIAVLPNPCYGQCMIQVNTIVSEPVAISITNIAGIECYRATLKTNQPLPLHPDWLPGLYMVHADTKEEHLVKNIIIQ